MKFTTVVVDGAARLAVIENGRAVRLFDEPIRDVADLAAALANSSGLPGTAPFDPVPPPVLGAPIPRPRRNIFCVGKNYYAHAREFAASGYDSNADPVPEAAIIFSKVPETVIGPGEPIEFDPAVSTAIDYEAEFAVIIGKRGKTISKASAMDHVWGYTIINDVTARDVQSRLKQWHVGKSFDGFCPMGPWAVTADEVDLSDTRLRCWVNGELRQDANTRDLIFDVPTIIETLSAGITLHPGDLIATGTPAGVGIGFDPPRFLRDGDVVTIEIAGIGRLENPVRTRGGPR